MGFGHLVVAAVELRDLETVRRGVGWSVYTRGFPAELGAPAPLPSPVGDYLQLLQMETNQVASLMRALTADDLAALAWFYPLSEPLRLNQLEPVTTLQLFEYLIAHDAAHYDAINRVLSGRRR